MCTLPLYHSTTLPLYTSCSCFTVGWRRRRPVGRRSPVQSGRRSPVGPVGPDGLHSSESRPMICPWPSFSPFNTLHKQHFNVFSPFFSDNTEYYATLPACWCMGKQPGFSYCLINNSTTAAWYQSDKLDILILEHEDLNYDFEVTLVNGVQLWKAPIAIAGHNHWVVEVLTKLVPIGQVGYLDIGILDAFFAAYLIHTRGPFFEGCHRNVTCTPKRACA